MNAWSNQFSLDLLAAIREVTEDPGVRAVLVTGAGRAFSSGADLKEAAEQAGDGTVDVYRILTERYHPLITGIRRMPKPVIAAVNGPAAGIGLSLALACDLVVAAESAYFSLAFVNIGLVPDGGSSLFVPSRVGFARAAELAMLGERLDARKALDWGLINQVWPDEEFASQAEKLLDRLASGATKSYAGTKRQLNQWLYQHMDAQLEFEAADPEGDGRLGRLRRGARGLRREAAAPVQRRLIPQAQRDLGHGSARAGLPGRGAADHRRAGRADRRRRARRRRRAGRVRRGHRALAGRARPPNPGGWLATTARRKAIDRLRRARAGQQKLALLAATATEHMPGTCRRRREIRPTTSCSA